MEKLDLLVCIVPHYDTGIPGNSPFIINGIAKQSGFKSKVIDFNHSLSKKFENVFEGEVDNWVNADVVFDDEDPKALEYANFINTLDEWTEIIINHAPKYVGFSTLTYLNYLCIVELSKRLKSRSDIKIVVGGVSSNWLRKYLEDTNQFDLIDHLVIGYGEGAIQEILNGNVDEKIVTNLKIDFDVNYIPDYSDINMKDYGKKLYLSASWGCIYRCSFCLVKHIWNRFIVRPVDHVLEEMNFMKNTYGITKFKLTDSIINANMKYTRELCNELSNHKFKWSGMFSIRSTAMVEDDYRLLKAAGCTFLRIGVESGSQSVREDMGKRYTNEDIFTTLHYLKKYELESELLFITGYPTESDEDFLLTKKLIEDVKAGDYLVESMRSAYLSLKNVTELQGIEDNPNFIKRYERYSELRDHMIKLGFRVRTDTRLKKWCDLSMPANK